VELKQWDKVKKTTKDAIVSTRFAAGEQEVAHPSYQAWSYAALLKNFNEAVYTGGIELRPCAYLHNYPQAGGDINDVCYAEHNPHTLRRRGATYSASQLHRLAAG
jgi:hypothetical protein